MGYVDLTDCREISPEHSRENDKPKCVGKFGYVTHVHFFRGFHLRNESCIFFRCEYLDNQSEYRKSPTHFC